jgi:hypothetical protein
MCIMVLQDSVHKLGSRTWIYFTWKIIYAVLPEIEKHFYKKIYMITLCNFWHRSWSWPHSQHIQKLATEVLWFLRYCRSRVFTLVFFMQKLKGISSGQNNKSCSINHHGSNKIVSHFSEFSVIFYATYKIQQNCWTVGVTLLRLGLWEELEARNVVLGAVGRRGLANSGEAGGALARGRGGGGPRGH